MTVLHITPHLGGGVGKAHAALCAADPEAGERHFVLLEEPRDTRYADLIKAAGAELTLATDRQQIASLIAGADIVQFEWWNHPLICGFLAGPPLPPMRSVIWSHVSGVHAPFIPSGLLEQADRFVFTSACSRQAPNLSKLGESIDRAAVINSGFCHDGIESVEQDVRRGVAYLGTVDFSKMSPAMMTVIDRLDRDDVSVDFWGGVADESPLHQAISEMKHPGRVRLRGHTDAPMAALATRSVFLYLLQSNHFGTAENALIEAMSLGCAPIVFANPCECEIVRHGETGLVAGCVDEAAAHLSRLIAEPEEARRLGENARREVLATKTPARSMEAFRSLWDALCREPKRSPDFASALGPTPRHWFRVLQGGDASGGEGRESQAASKGTLAHFLAHYPDLDAAIALASDG